MSNEQFQFLNLRHWPLRLDKLQLCSLLNCQPHDLPALMQEKLVVPLGNPAENGRKFFETKAILDAAQDRKWLSRVTECIRRNWKKHNLDDDDEELFGEKDARLAA